LIGAGAVSSADAVTPRPLRYLVHQHGVQRDAWHIEMIVAKDRRYLRQLVLHSVRCDETVFTTRVRIRSGGTIASSKPFSLGDDGRTGTWRLDARWIAPNVVVGTFQITKPGCDAGVRAFAARAGGRRGQRHVNFGTAHGTYPDLSDGGKRALDHVNRLWKDSMAAAARRFATYADARKLGFERWSRDWKPPLIFHVRHAGYERDARVFDARRPESLVYWWPPAGKPVLIAFMYRAAAKRGWPAFGKPLLGWHTHGPPGPGVTLMTHVWMTGDLRSAIANCMPVEALEAANPRFRLVPIAHDLSAESVPCPAPPARATSSARTVKVGDNYFVRASGVPTVTVRRGERVTWRWIGRRPHNVRVTSGPERFASPTKRRGSYSRTVRRRGAYTIVCDIHGGRDQRMRLVVR
jgi:plastocyanin